MVNTLSSEDAQYLKDLLRNQNRGVRALAMTANLLLLIGGTIIIGTAVYLIQHLTDSLAYSVGLPNFIGGMLFIAGYVFLSKRITQLKKLSSLLSKLSGMGVAT